MTLDEQIEQQKALLMAKKPAAPVDNLDAQIAKQKQMLTGIDPSGVPSWVRETPNPVSHINASQYFMLQKGKHQGHDEDDDLRDFMKTKGDLSLAELGVVQSERADAVMKGPGSDSEKKAKLMKIIPGLKFENTPDGVVMVHQGKRYRAFTPGHEGYDELPYLQSGKSWRSYSTPEGKKGAVRGMINQMLGGKKNVNDYLGFSKDSYGNMIAVIKKPFKVGMLGDSFKAGKYYLDKPGLTFKDVHSVGPAIDDFKWLIAGGKGVGALKWKAAIPVAGGIGAGGELINQAERGESDMDRVAAMGVGAAIGEGVGRVVFKVGGAGYNALKGAIKKYTGKTPKVVVDKAGNLKPEIAQELEKKGIGPGEVAEEIKTRLSSEQLRNLKGDQAVRNAEIKAVTGESGTPGQITRNYGKMHNEAKSAEIVGVGEKLRAKLARQDQAIVGGIEKMGKEAGGVADPHVFGHRGVEALRAEQTRRTAATTKAYDSAAIAAGNKSLIAKKKFSDSMREVVEEWEDAIPSAIKKRISEFGDGTRNLTLKNVEDKLVKFINKRLYASNDPAVKKALGQMQGSLRKLIDDMGERAGKAGPLYKVAKASNRIKQREFGSKDIVKKIVNGEKITENIAQDLLRSNVGINEFVKVVSLLQRNTAGRLAIRDLRTHMMDGIVKAAKSNQGAGDFTIKVEALKKHVSKLLDSRKLQALFTRDQVDKLRLLVRVADYRKFPSGVYPKGSASTLINFFEGSRSGMLMGRWLAPIVSPIVDALKKQAAKKVVEKSVTRKGTQAIINKQAKRREILRRKVKQRKVRRKGNVFSPAIGAEYSNN